MASPHRKLFPKQPEENSTTSIVISPPPSIPTVDTCINIFCDPVQNDTVEGFCPTVCLALCPSICKYSLPDLLSPPPQPNKSHNLSPLLISMLIILAILFVVISFYIVYTRIYPYLFNNINSQTRPGRARSWRGSYENDTYDEEQHGQTVLFHPIWYIPTVGLNPSLINSITVHTYHRSSKGGVHVDGSDCAVCLAEFQDGDELRILPKCNHAFHLPCIDTWLRSHTNCPLCRAPVVVVSDSDNQMIDHNSSSPTLRVVDVTTEDRDDRDRDRDDDRRVNGNVLRRSSSFDGNIENNKKEMMMIMNSGGNKESGSSSLRYERGPVCLVGRSFSCTAKIFTSRYNNNNNNNNNNNG